MPATRQGNPTSIKVVPPDDILLVPGGEIRADRDRGLPANCFIVPMEVLPEPEPVRRAQPKAKK